jgi:hypothetical protein
VLLLPPVAGWVRAATGSYSADWLWAGACMMAGAAFFVRFPTRLEQWYVAPGAAAVGAGAAVGRVARVVEAAPGPSYVLKTLDDVYKFMDEGSQFNHRNGCVPVGYEARYLKNNSILMTHTGISYKINDCL